MGRRPIVTGFTTTIVLLAGALWVQGEGRDDGIAVRLGNEIEINAVARGVDTQLSPGAVWLLTVSVDPGAAVGPPTLATIAFDGSAQEVEVEAVGYELSVKRRRHAVRVDYEASGRRMRAGAAVILWLTDGEASFYGCRQVGENPPPCPPETETNSRAWG